MALSSLYKSKLFMIELKREHSKGRHKLADKKESGVTSTVSSKINKYNIRIKLSTLVTGILFVVLVGISFYGGVVYQRGETHRYLASSSRVKNRFDWGMVVFVNPTSITIDSQRTNTIKKLNVTKSTVVSIDGTPAKISDIRTGEIVLVKVKNSLAQIVLVNSNFTD